MPTPIKFDSASYPLDQVYTDHIVEMETKGDEQENIQIILTNINNHVDKDEIMRVISKYTLLNPNDSNKKFNCFKGYSIRELLKGPKSQEALYKQGLFFMVSESLITLIISLNKLGVSHDNMTLDTVFSCQQFESTEVLHDVKFVDFSSMTQLSKPSDKRKRASLVLLLEDIMKGGKFQNVIVENFACQIINAIMMPGKEWSDMLIIFDQLKEFQDIDDDVLTTKIKGLFKNNHNLRFNDTLERIRYPIFQFLINNNDILNNASNDLPASNSGLYYYIEDIKFGFEYEVLVKVINPKFGRLLDLARDTRVMTDLTDCNTDSWVYEDYTIERFIFTSVLQSLSNVNFNATSSYHGKKCNIHMFNHIDKDVSRDWLIDDDGSVLYNGNDSDQYLQNIEIVSPILSYSEVNGKYFRHILDKILTANGWFEYHNNESTSNHVHLSHNENFTRPDMLFKCVMAWVLFEPIFMTFVSRDRHKNTFCVSLSNNVQNFKDYDDLIQCKDVDEFNKLESHKQLHKTTRKRYTIGYSLVRYYFTEDDRYYALNLDNLEEYKTLEIRLKHGSNDSRENQKWMLLLGHFFIYAMNNPCVTNKYFDLLKQKIKLDTSDKTSVLEIEFWKIINNKPLQTYWTSKTKSVRQPSTTKNTTYAT